MVDPKGEYMAVIRPDNFYPVRLEMASESASMVGGSFGGSTFMTFHLKLRNGDKVV